MAIIRNTSNPEKLYIWNQSDKRTYVMAGSEEIGSLPTNIFYGLLKKYYRKLDDCEYKGAKIKEVEINVNYSVELDMDISEFRMELSYNNWKVLMWEVTWAYIVLTEIKSIRY